MGADFSAILEELAHGDVNRHASEKLTEVVQAVDATGKKGRIVISLNVTKEGGRCVLEADIKTTKPELSTAPTMFFFGREGSILRDDPRQLDLKTIYKPVEPVDMTQAPKTETNE